MEDLVSAAWVTERLSSPDLVLLDATLPPVGVKPPPDTRASYGREHLPGALFFDIEQRSDQQTPLPHMLPTPERFAEEMSVLGVSSEATIVVYEQGDVFSAPRAWWMLRTLGARHVGVLDGGLQGWKEAGLLTASDAVQRPPASFTALREDAAVVEFTMLQRRLAEGQQVVDARLSGRFLGSSPEPRPGLPSGHMPGALNLPYLELIDGTRMRPAEELRRIFARHGVDLAQPIVATCGSGVTAAVVTLALRLCGAPQTSLYDGSWAEYAQQRGVAIKR